MAVLGTFDPTSLIADDLDLQHRQIIVLSGQGVLLRGTVVGVVTASGKAIKSVRTAVDGSQTPTGVLSDDIDATSADVTCNEYETGVFAFEKMIVDASWSFAQLDAAFRARGQALFMRVTGTAA